MHASCNDPYVEWTIGPSGGGGGRGGGWLPPLKGDRRPCPDKSSVMQVGKALHDRHRYVICGKIIEPSNIVRDLGILYYRLYNSKLRFNDYIEDINCH